MTVRDEKGSLIVALAVILVLSGLSLAILARTISAIGSARLAQDSAAAAAAADTGVTDALYVLDHGGPLSGNGQSFSWTATLDGGGTSGTVKSTGTVNGHSHTVTVAVQRPARWPWTVGTSGSLVLDGSITVDGRVGVGGQMVARDGATDGTEQDLLGPGASCSGCTDPVAAAHDTGLPEPEVPTPPPSPPPGGCAAITAIPSGTWLCEDAVSFAAGASIAGPLNLYVVPSGAAPATVTFAGAVQPTSGQAKDFIVHVVGAGVITPGTSIVGVIDAPHSTLRSNPCSLTLTGAADLGSFDCVTGPGGSATLGYDASVAGVLSPTWQEATPYADASS